MRPRGTRLASERLGTVRGRRADRDTHRHAAGRLVKHNLYYLCPFAIRKLRPLPEHAQDGHAINPVADDEIRQRAQRIEVKLLVRVEGRRDDVPYARKFSETLRQLVWHGARISSDVHHSRRPVTAAAAGVRTPR